MKTLRVKPVADVLKGCVRIYLLPRALHGCAAGTGQTGPRLDPSRTGKTPSLRATLPARHLLTTQLPLRCIVSSLPARNRAGTTPPAGLRTTPPWQPYEPRRCDWQPVASKSTQACRFTGVGCTVAAPTAASAQSAGIGTGLHHSSRCSWLCSPCKLLSLMLL